MNRNHAVKFIVTEMGLFLILLILQTTVMARWRWFGAVPDLCFAGLILLSCFCGKETGAVTGIALGFCVDALGSTGISLLPVCYLFCGYLWGYFGSVYGRQSTLTCFLLALAALPVRTVITLLLTLLSHHGVTFLPLLLNLLAELGANALATVALFFPLRRIGRFLVG